MLHISMESELPRQGRVCIRLESKAPLEMTLHVRIPSWTRGYEVRVNAAAWEPLPLPPDRQTPVATACGVAPHGSFFVPIRRTWVPGDSVELHLPMPIMVRRPMGRVRGGHGTAAISRGPLVYCLESIDQPGMDLFSAKVDLATLRLRLPEDAAPSESLPEDLTLSGRAVDGQRLTFLPYYAWANRGPSQMTVMVRV